MVNALRAADGDHDGIRAGDRVAGDPGMGVLPVTVAAPAGAVPLRDTTVTSWQAAMAASASTLPVPEEPPTTVIFTPVTRPGRRRRPR